MSVTVDLPEAVVRRLESEASRRGVGIDAVIADLVGTLPEPTTGHHRRLAISGIGASGGGRGRASDTDELLADGFGRD